MLDQYIVTGDRFTVQIQLMISE